MHGIVHPPERSNGVVVVLFNIGLHYRTSHSRMFVRLARHLQALGEFLLRQIERFASAANALPHGNISV